MPLLQFLNHGEEKPRGRYDEGRDDEPGRGIAHHLQYGGVGFLHSPQDERTDLPSGRRRHSLDDPGFARIQQAEEGGAGRGVRAQEDECPLSCFDRFVIFERKRALG